MGKVKKKYLQFNRFINGIADFEKEGVENSVAFSRHADLRSDPRSISLLPKTQKESGSTVLDLPKWGERVDDDVYIYGDTGYIYKRSLTATYTNMRKVASSHGNGLAYFAEDDFLYYTSDKLLGRYGPMDNDNQDATFADDFLGSEGGIPTNTYSTNLEENSSMYFTRADSAPLSITSDISMEIWAKLESLPAATEEMVLMGKWNENSLRSYKMSLYGLSGVFGDGSAGALTISADTTQSPTDSACSGTSGLYTLSATNASFAAGQIVLIHQTQGTGAGTYQVNRILSYTSGTITLEDPLNYSYSSTGSNKAQVIVSPQYTTVTVDSGFTWSAKAWNGTVGGILLFHASGAVAVNGTISAGLLGPGGGYSTNNQGFRGATTASGQGEGTSGDRNTVSAVANGSGGGGGTQSVDSGGGGGGHAIAGSDGVTNSTGAGGTASGTADLSSMTFGGGGGRGGGSSGEGGYGGGIVFATVGGTITVNNSTGYIKANGSDGQVGSTPKGSGGGGGAGGSILIRCTIGTLNTTRILAQGGQGGTTGDARGNGGAGADGRIHIDYLTSYTGTTTPTIDATQDDTLSGSTEYQLRFTVSSTGSNADIMRYNLTTLDVDMWNHFAVTWDASASLATFYRDGAPVGTATGTLTAIYDSTAVFSIGAAFNSGGTAEKFFDGSLDEARLWNDIRTDSEIFLNRSRELVGTEAGLVAYYQFDNNANDSGPNGYTLTAVNSPTYTTDVPFSAPTSRLDLDQSLDTSGNTYTTPTAISETATTRQDFVPAKDPQKSIEVLIAAIGTGDWTLTVHDSLNRVVATKTVANGSLNTGDFEFIFSETWRPIIGATYHFHITSTVADGTVTTTTNADLNTVDFHTYYQFLVEDTAWHPIMHYQNFLCIGNERYLAKWDASTYTPHKLTLPAGYRIRSFGLWNEYIAIGTMRGSNIYDYETGRVFFWDGTSTTYNFFIDVPEGGINALFGSRGVLHIFAGYQGDHLEYRGGASATKVKRVPKIEKNKRLEIYPGAINMWRTLLHYGVAGASNSSAVQRGVYSWGSLNRLYADAQTLDYTISTTRYDDNVTIGMVFPVAEDLLIGWKDGVTYGVDVVDMSADPFSSGTVEFPITDYGSAWKEKDAQTVRADHKTLVSGHTYAVKYKLDRATNWTEMTSVGLSPHSYSASEDTVKAQKTRLPIMGGRHKEIQLALDLTTSTTTSPKVFSVGLEYSPLQEEEQF